MLEKVDHGWVTKILGCASVGISPQFVSKHMLSSEGGWLVLLTEVDQGVGWWSDWPRHCLAWLKTFWPGGKQQHLLGAFIPDLRNVQRRLVRFNFKSFSLSLFHIFYPIIFIGNTTVMSKFSSVRYGDTPLPLSVCSYLCPFIGAKKNQTCQHTEPSQMQTHVQMETVGISCKSVSSSLNPYNFREYQ